MEQVRGGPSQCFWTNLEQQVAPKYGPGVPKLAKNAQKLQFQVPVVRNGWNSMERRWSKLGEVHAEVYGPIWCSRVPPNLTQGAPETAKIGPKCPKMAISRFRWSKTVGTAWNKGGMGPETSAGISLNPFHLGSWLFQPFWTTKTLKLPFLAILGQYWPFWSLLGQI